VDYLQIAQDRLSTCLSTWRGPAHPILPEQLSSRVDAIKERIVEHQLQWQIQAAKLGNMSLSSTI
jgi:hypothetical protein